MADLGEIWEQAKRFQDRRVVELASQAIRRRSEIESLVGAAEALRLLVAAKLALLEDAIEVARAGLHSSALRTDARADALRLLALAEAVRGSSGAERQYSEAIAAAEKAFLFFMDHGDERHQVDASVALSHLHLLRGESGDLHLATQAAERAVASAGDELALRWADEALELAQELGDAPLEVEVRSSMAQWSARRSDAAATLLQAKEALDLLQELGASSHRQIALTRLAADAAVQLKDPQQGVRLCQQLVRLCRVEKAEVPGVFAALQLLRTLVAAQRWEEAKTTGHEILSFCQQKEDLLCEAQVLRLLLEAYRKSSASEMLSTWQRSLELVPLVPQVSTAVELLTEVLQASAPLKRPLEALPCAMQLQALAPMEVKAPLLMAMGSALFEGGALEECCRVAQDSARLAEELGDEGLSARALALVANAQVKLGKFSAARQNARRARRRFGEIGDHEEDVRMRLLVAKACLCQDERGRKQPKDAVREAQEAAKLAKELDEKNSELVVSSLVTLVEVLSEAQEWEKCQNASIELLRQYPEKEAFALFHAAKAQQKLGQAHLAKTYLERVSELAARDVASRSLLEEAQEMLAALGEISSRPQQDENAYPGRCLHCGAASCSCAKQQRGGHNGDGMLRPGPAMRKGFLTSTMLREEDEHLKQRIQELANILLALPSPEDVSLEVPLSELGLTSGAAVLLRDELQREVKHIRV
ncbi:Carrier domain-containing protein [Durusdinium trenchii]|uniref:Carrier domain-containing protein n=1 Tax=Durusdinium trenchii TaxID=1381693 RepID=A0ABP0RZ26_9DINO